MKQSSMEQSEIQGEQIRDLLQFIEKSPCACLAAAQVGTELERAGYLRLYEEDEWQLESGGRYFVVRNDSSLIAFHIPKSGFRGFHMISAHSDSPSFKLKESPELRVEEAYTRLNVEKYGGMILSTWMDRPLSIAGRVSVWEENQGLHPVTKLVHLDRDLLVIPNLAIHMQPKLNQGLEYNVQTDLLPLFSDGKEGQSVKSLVAEAAGVEEDEILGSDLFLYCREKGRILGAGGEFILSPRLDDLECVYCAMQAMLQSEPSHYINVMAVFDHEEVGSTTRNGAASSFLEEVLQGICASLGQSGQSYWRLLADSFMISADNAHGVHPNHPEKADPVNRPYLNRGIVIKYHGGQKYATDSVSAAVMKRICREAGVPCQSYANRSDIAGGTTLGNIAASRVSVPTVDIGFAQLAMHSAMETAGAGDVGDMIKVMKHFFS